MLALESLATEHNRVVAQDRSIPAGGIKWLLLLIANKPRDDEGKRYEATLSLADVKPGMNSL